MSEQMISFSGLVQSPEYQAASPQHQKYAVGKWAKVRLGGIGDTRFRGQVSDMFVRQHDGGMSPEQNQQFIEMMATGDGGKNHMASTIDSAKRAGASFAESAAGLADWAGIHDQVVDGLHRTAQEAAMNAQIPESVAESLGEFDMGDLTKLDFWTTKGAEQIFVNLPFMVTGVGTSALALKSASAGAKGVLAASAAGSAAMTVQESLFEAGTAYNQALAVSEGDREKAGEVAFNVFWNNAALLGATNTGELAATLTLGRFLPKAVRGSFKDWLRAGGIAVGGASLEGAQELVQKYYSDAGVSFAAGDREDLPGFVPGLGDVIEILRTPDGREAFVMGFLMQAGTSAAFNAGKTADSVMERLENGTLTPEEAAIDLMDIRDQLGQLSDQQLEQAKQAVGTVQPEEATRGQTEDAVAADIRTAQAQEASAAQAVPIENPSEEIQGAIKEMQSESPLLADAPLVPVQDTPEMARYRRGIEAITDSPVVLVASDRQIPMAGYTSENGTILINAQSSQPFRHVIAHELTHQLEQQHPDLYQEVAKLSEGHTGFLPLVNKAREEQGFRPLSADEVPGEIAAEYVQANILEPKFWRRIARGSKDQSAGKKAGMLTKLLQKVTARVPVDAPGMQELLKTQDTLQNIFQRWADRPTVKATEPAAEKAEPVAEPVTEPAAEPKAKTAVKPKAKTKGTKEKSSKGDPGWLTNSKPKYVRQQVHFESSTDKAVYLATSRSGAKRRESLEYLKGKGISREQAVQRGKKMRNDMKKHGPGDITYPAMSIDRRAAVDPAVAHILAGDKGAIPAPGNRAIPVENEALRNAFRILDEQRELSKESRVHSREEARQEAREEIEDMGFATVMERLVSEGTHTDTDVMAYHQILNDDGMAAILSGDNARLRQHVDLMNEYRDDGARMAKAFAARADIYETPAERARGTLVKAILHPGRATDVKLDRAKAELERAKAEAARAKAVLERTRAESAREKAELERKLKEADQKLREAERKLDDVMDEQAQKVKDLIDHLEENGISVEDIDFNNPEEVQTAIRVIRGKKATTAEKIYEFWMNAILSGPKTHAANILGTGYAVWNGLVVRGFESMVNGLTGNSIEGAATFDEMKVTWRGLSNGIGDAGLAAILAFKTETAAFQLSFDDGSTKFEKDYQPGAIIGTKGRVIRVPTRSLVSTDEFFKTLFWNGMVGAMAHRSGVAQGLSGKALEEHIGDKVGDKQSVEARAALEWSKDKLFQNEDIRNLPGWSLALETADRLRSVESSKWPALNWFFRYLIPFVTTPSNLARIGMGRLTPLGIPIMAWKAFNTYRVKEHGKGNASWVYGSRADIVHDAFNQILVTSGFMALAKLIDEEDPFITGTGVPRGNAGRRDLQNRLQPAMSFRVPTTDKWYSYRRLDPLASGLASMVDAITAMKKLKRGVAKDRVFSDWAKTQTTALSEKTYLKAIGDLIVGIQLSKYGVAGGVERWGTSFAGSFWPAIFRHAALASDDQVRDLRRAPESGVGGWMSEVGGRAFRLPYGVPKRDPWGRPITKNGSGVATEIGRFFSPTLVVDSSKATSLDRMLHSWNLANEGNADAEYWIPIPEPKFRYRKEEFVLSKSEYDDYIRIRGELMVRMYPKVSAEVAKSPSAAHIRRLQEVERRAKRMAKIQIIKKRRSNSK